VVGDLVEDVVVWPDGPVRTGTDTPARVFHSRGGSAANVAVAAAPLVPTRWLGCVGPDPLGDRLLGELQAAGIDVRAQRRGRTGTIVVLVDPDGERTFLPDRGAAGRAARRRPRCPRRRGRPARAGVRPAGRAHGGLGARAAGDGRRPRGCR
jgi:sugar/nucleoside kinase (ribokinase family)